MQSIRSINWKRKILRARTEIYLLKGTYLREDKKTSCKRPKTVQDESGGESTVEPNGVNEEEQRDDDKEEEIMEEETRKEG